jgi:hypothetical protein
VTVSDIDIDQTDPVITITTPAEGASYVLNQSVAADYFCTDATSGIASCVGDVADGSDIDTSSIGAHTFTVDAEDNAGNTDSLTHNYSVSYALCGWDGGTVKSGATIPIKLYLCDADGINYSSSGVVVKATSLKRQDNTASGVVEDSGSANPDNNFRFDATLFGTGGYIFNLSTKSPSPALGAGSTKLNTGTWKLCFSVDGVGGYSITFDVK